MNSRISSYFFFILLLLAAIAAVFIFLPFLTPLVLGAAAAVVAHPIYRGVGRMLGVRGQRSNLAALITVILVLVIVLVPLFLVIGNMYSEVQSLYASLTDEGGRSQTITTLNNFSQKLSDAVFGVFPAYSFDNLNVTDYIKSALEWVFANLDTIVGGLIKVAGYAFIFLVSLFYFLRDGELFKRRFIAWSPLLDDRDEYITRTMRRAVFSVFAGTLAVSVIQGALTGLGFYLFHIPAPVVWGSAASVASMIPGIGTSLIIVPGIVYLVITGQYLYGIGLAIWGIFAVGLVDNFLGPHLVNKGVNAHPFLILISVLGGIATF
ncbi:MAG: AI-2E family transporter, partial [Patescibacteria group bacterium]|nr:AI-2E family transporter [Patescibacteria group bacterium]